MLSMAILPKVPPIMPLIPYMPAIFKITFLPPFYFTYWIITIIIIAVFHEFAHGIIARGHGIKVKSTGFGFLGPFLAAFVEVDEKAMSKKSSKAQLAVLSAGSFANVIIAAIFLLLLNGFFVSTYSPIGINFNTYATSNISISDISGINNIGISKPAWTDIAVTVNKIVNQSLMENKSKTSEEIEIVLKVKNKTHFTTAELALLQAKIGEKSKKEEMITYSDNPAYNAKLSGAIKKISDREIQNLSELNDALSRFKPGDEIKIETTVKNYTIKLASHPQNSSKAFLGIGFYESPKSTFSKLINIAFFKKDSFIYYEPKFVPGLIVFIYNLLLWVVLINFSVALMNMLPVVIFDGGKFFYITVLSLTKSKEKAVLGLRIANYAILFFFLAVTFIWWIKAF